MRKIQQLVTVVAVVGGLAGLGAGTAAAHHGNPSPQQAPQSHPEQASQVHPGQAPQQAPHAYPQQTSRGYGPLAPQQGTHVTYSTSSSTTYANRPAMQCSSEKLAEVNIPVALLRPAQTSGFSCEQNNAALNRY